MPETISGRGQPGPEAERPKERTKESEIKANIEFWKGRGVEVDEEDIRAKIEELPEVEGFDGYLYLPPMRVDASQRLSSKDEPEFYSLIPREGPSFQFIYSSYPGWTIEMPRPPEQSYAIAFHWQSEPDDDSLRENAKSAEEWEKTGETFMTYIERCFAELRWYIEGENFAWDVKNETLCPGCRTFDGFVPCFGYTEPKGTAYVFAASRPETIMYGYKPSESDPWVGVRRVITKDTKVKQGEEA